MAKRGPKSTLTPELTLTIRSLCLKLIPYVEIMERLGIKDKTWESWTTDNYQGFADDLIQWKLMGKELRREAILDKSERNLCELADSKDEKIRADIAKYATSTLGKTMYSTRQEQTGENGTPLFDGVTINYNVGQTNPEHNLITKTTPSDPSTEQQPV